MNRKLQFALLLLLITSQVIAQKAALQSISENDLEAHLEFIASDYMMGRDFNTTTPGLELTADYLRTQCQKMGLKPGGENYFQNIQLHKVSPDFENTHFQLIAENKEVAFEDMDIFSFGGGKDTEIIEGDIVFAGYGWNDNDKYNDFKDLDLKDKIVVVMTRNPDMALGATEHKIDENIEMVKIGMVAKAGAKALIIIPDPMNPDAKWFDMVKGYVSGGSVTMEGSKNKSFIPITLIFGTEKLGDAILKESGKSLANIQKDINDSGKPKSINIKDFQANIQLARKSEPAVGKNVIGIIEGSDPVLKNECIVFTAHYDHVGVSPTGEVNNGADDNGTGTVALLEIAEAFQQLKKKPKRSIVFAWVTAEEKGLIGSDYYAQNPVYPLGNTLVNINLDMVGRSAEEEPDKEAGLGKSLAGPNGLYIVSGKQSSELSEISNEVCDDLGLIPNDNLTKAFLSRSDHYHFYKNGIPIIGLSTGLHEDYHQPSDEVEKIDYTKMKRVSQYAFLVANKVANKKKRIVVDKPVGNED